MNSLLNQYKPCINNLFCYNPLLDMKENMEAAATNVVNQLWEVALAHERIYPSEIQAVLVFSGPGTYYDKLKPNQAEYMRWMDRDRIRAGVAVVREVTASNMRDLEIGPNKKGYYVSKEDVEWFGPFFVYNGIPIENKVIREVLRSEKCKLPQEKVLIIDEVRETDKIHAIRHTGDQYSSFYQELINPSSPLNSIENVALVAHIPDFIRHPFYAKLYQERLRSEHGRNINFWAYGLKSRPGTELIHTNEEIKRLVPYAQ